ncbi:MAG TPA: cytochrome c [Steroidobacteraceae bacterium]|nr:cytochrome c [Steroidobacteraceae bacterium]
MNARLLLMTASAMLVSTIVVPAAWPQAKPEVLLKQRQAAMTLQAKYFGPLVGILRGTSPYDPAVVGRNARYLEALAAMPWDGFPESTQGEESRALPAVWSDAERFRRMAGEFQSAVATLVAASDAGREEDVRTAIEGVGKACGGCHDAFRRK